MCVWHLIVQILEANAYKLSLLYPKNGFHSDLKFCDFRSFIKQKNYGTRQACGFKPSTH